MDSTNKLDIIVFVFVLFSCIFILVNLHDFSNNVKLTAIESYITSTPIIYNLTQNMYYHCNNELSMYDNLTENDTIVIMKSCLIWEVKIYVESNITYVNDTGIDDFFMLNNQPDKTVLSGNDCDGKAILAASLLKELNISNIYFVRQEFDNGSGHVCVLVDNNYDFVQINCFIESSNITYIKNV